MTDDVFLLVERHDCPLSTCAVPAGSPCRTTRGLVAADYHTARIRLAPETRAELKVRIPAVRTPGKFWTQLPPPPASLEPVGRVRIGYARTSTSRQNLGPQLDMLQDPERGGVKRVFQEQISTRVKDRPELAAALAFADELQATGIAVTLVVTEHKRLGRGSDLVTLAEKLKASGITLEFLTGDLRGEHDPSGPLFAFLAAMSGMEREYIRDQTLDGQESARTRGKMIGGVRVTDTDMLSMALHLREQDPGISLRDLSSRLVITNGAKKGKHPSPATVMRMLREHDAAPLSPRTDL
ncbi:recombinase family protein [Streptomyces sp. NPDC006514]|uniref:recombinase family protein n=1 Tax=Streptomyces sp. NPDC006514 TaxID=3154308 RepID=UPI0033AF8CED